MIDVKVFYEALLDEGIINFCGVPDSLLKNICAYIADHTSLNNHLITANEGSAIALATGQYIATGKPSLVYMQNSGFGNAINPLLSLADPKVYGIPMLLMVGWRGEPGFKDEPQHIKQGLIMEPLIDVCGYLSVVIEPETTNIKYLLREAVLSTTKLNQPVVLLIKKNTFSEYKLKNDLKDLGHFTREEAIKEIIRVTSPDDIFVSTTGMASRELYEIREKSNMNHNRDFLTVGSMGHANMIALGIAQNSKKQIICIDGDGSVIMHLGNLTSIGHSMPKNFIHIIINNISHDSVGGQPTCADRINIPMMAKSFGYNSAIKIKELNELKDYFLSLKGHDGPHLIEIIVKRGSRKDLGRPNTLPSENKKSIMRFINSSNEVS